MHTQVPRFASQLRLRLFVFIITCLSIGTGISFSQIADSQNPPTANQQNIRTWELPDGAIMRLGKGVLGGSDRAIAFSPDGKHLAVASGIGIWIYEVATAREHALLNGGRPTLIRSVAYSPDGTILAAGTGNGTIQFWEVENRRRLPTRIMPRLRGPAGEVDALAFSPDGKTLASGTYEDVTLWDVETGGHLSTLKGHEHRIFSLAFSPDGTTLVSGAEDDTAKLWDVTTGKNLATLKHARNVSSVALSPDGASLAAAASKSVTLWNIETHKKIVALSHSYHVDSVAYSPDGRTVVSGSWREVSIWDVSTANKIATLEQEGRVGALAFSPDGKILASANTDRFGGSDGTIVLWNISAREYVGILKGHTERITTVAFLPDGSRLAAMLRDGTVKFWNTRTGQHVSTLRKTGVWSMALSPDGETLASGSFDGTVKLSDVRSGRRVAILRGHGGSVDSVAFSPDGTKFAAGARDDDQQSLGIVKLWEFPPKAWDVLRQQPIKTLEVASDRGISVAFSSDSRILAVGSDDGAKLFDADTGENVATLNEPYSNIVALSPVGTILAAGAAGGIKLWDVLTSKKLRHCDTRMQPRRALSRSHLMSRHSQ